MYNSNMFLGKPAELIEAIIDEVSVSEEGEVLIDVYDNSGDYYSGVKILGVGGNGLVWSNIPIRKGQMVKLIKTGEYNWPICIGSTEKVIPQDELAQMKPLIATLGDSVNNNEDVVSNYTTDWSIYNNVSHLKVTENNGCVIQSSQMLRLQLQEQALLRISKDGATVDSPLNGQQFIDALFAYLDALETKVNANSQFVTAAAPGVAAAFAAAATAADASAPGSGQIFRDQAQDASEAATEAAIPLTTTSATTKTSAEDTINQNILIP